MICFACHDEHVCSYCGCSAITVIGRYMAEHEQIINLAGELRRAVEQGDRPQLCAAAAILREQLQPHTGSEERSLFAELRRDPEFTEHVDSLCAEHERLQVLLSAVESGDGTAFAPFELLLRQHI